MRSMTECAGWPLMSSGLTLIELLITLSVASILLTIAVPSLWSMVEDNRLTAEANAFLTDLSIARGQAIARGRRVTMRRCKPDSNGRCTQSSGAYLPGETGGDWADGWVVWADKDNDDQHDSNEEVIRLHNSLSGSLSLSGSGSISDYIAYDARGTTSQTTGGLQMGALVLQSSGQTPGGVKDYRRKITINAMGRVQICNPNWDSCSPWPSS